MNCQVLGARLLVLKMLREAAVRREVRGRHGGCGLESGFKTQHCAEWQRRASSTHGSLPSVLSRICHEWVPCGWSSQQ